MFNLGFGKNRGTAEKPTDHGPTSDQAFANLKFEKATKMKQTIYDGLVRGEGVFNELTKGFGAEMKSLTGLDDPASTNTPPFPLLPSSSQHTAPHNLKLTSPHSTMRYPKYSAR